MAVEEATAVPSLRVSSGPLVAGPDKATLELLS